MNHALAYLTDADWTLLRARSHEIRHERDEVIVREGAEARGMMLLKSGSARVEQTKDGMQVTLTRMEPGEIFGEMSLLEDTHASASVIADEPVTLELFERGHIEALLQSDPGFSARFHRSIAVNLSRRLRERSRLFSQLNVQAVAQVNRFHTTRLGQITSRQLPNELVAGVDAFKTAMASIEARPGPSPERRVDEACGALFALLDRFTRPEALFEMSYADLSSFRDPGKIAGGVGAYVFRQTFSWLMSAQAVARAYMKPRGFAEDHETLALVYEVEPEGDGVVGPLVDRFYLARPVCRSRREGRTMAKALLQKLAGEQPSGRRTSVACLASGTGGEAIEVLATPAGAGLRLSCVDLDHEALGAGARRAEELDVAARVAFVHGNVVPASPGAEGPMSIGRHDVVYALGLLEYLSDDECVRVLDWAAGALVPRGTFAAHTLGADNPDRALMEHVLEWRVHHRSRGELAQIFTRSRFGKEPRVEPDASGAGLFAVVTRD